jgi:tripartite-type tricarboxylate transporter receptor subunit TctC
VTTSGSDIRRTSTAKILEAKLRVVEATQTPQVHSSGLHMRLLRCLVQSALCMALTANAFAADTYPTRPVRLVVPFGPGGVGDLSSRAVAQHMSETLGQQVIIDNRPSAGGVVAAEMVAKAEPDGHTILLLNNQQAISVPLFKSLPYDPLRDFQGVSSVGRFSLVILVVPDAPYKTLSDLVAQIRANPGKFNIGTTNIGATQHLAAELLKSMARLDAVTIPYSTTGALLSELRGKRVQLAVEFAAPVIGQVKSGSLRALAVSTKTRYSALPDVPTANESGVPGYEVTSWNGMAVPAKTPRARVERLNKAIAAALSNATVAQRFQELAVDPWPSTPEAFQAHVKGEIAKWTQVIEDAHIARQ